MIYTLIYIPLLPRILHLKKMGIEGSLIHNIVYNYNTCISNTIHSTYFLFHHSLFEIYAFQFSILHSFSNSKNKKNTLAIRIQRFQLRILVILSLYIDFYVIILRFS